MPNRTNHKFPGHRVAKFERKQIDSIHTLGESGLNLGKNQGLIGVN